MKRLIIFSLLLAIRALAATVAPPPICPECGNSDNVGVAEEVSLELGLNVYVCPAHRIYYVNDPKYFSQVWYYEEDIPAVKADYSRLETERAATREEKAARLKANGWSDDIINRVLAGQIRIGDSPEIVREAWGPPGESYREDTTSGTAEIWLYTEVSFSQRWVRFEEGSVRQYQNGTRTIHGE